MNKHISVSQIKAYLRCPLSYRFKWIDNIIRPIPSVITLGKSIHHTLDKNYSQKVISKSDLPLAEVTDIFSDYWNKEAETTVFDADENSGNLKDEGIALIKTYHQKIAPVIQPEMVEHGFELSFENVDYTLKGYIDLIDNTSIIIDHKTTKRSMNQDAIDTDLQLTAYALAFRTFQGKNEAALRFDVMVRNKTPKVQQIATSRTQQDIDRFLKIVAYVVKAIDSGIFFPNENYLCSTCVYKDLCKKW